MGLLHILIIAQWYLSVAVPAPSQHCADADGENGACPAHSAALIQRHELIAKLGSVDEEQEVALEEAPKQPVRLALINDVRRARRAFAKASPKEAAELARQHFRELAGDDDGVSIDDMRAAYPDQGPSDSCMNSTVTDSALTAMIASLDTDADGTVSSTEFEAFLSSVDFKLARHDSKLSSLALEVCETVVARGTSDAAIIAEETRAKDQAAKDKAKAENGTRVLEEGRAKDVISKTGNITAAARYFANISKPLFEELWSEEQEDISEDEAVDASIGHEGERTEDEKLAGGDETLVPVDETTQTVAPASLMDARHALKAQERKVRADASTSSRGNPLIQGIAHALDDIWDGTVAAEHFSFWRAANPTNCEGGVCQKWGEDCLDWVDNSAWVCQNWVDEGYNSCTAGSNSVSRSCSQHLPSWLGWGCDVWDETTTWVCTSYRWVAHNVCKGWKWVAEGFCDASEWVCKAFECAIDWQYIKDKIDPSGPMALPQLSQPPDSEHVSLEELMRSHGKDKLDPPIPSAMLQRSQQASIDLNGFRRASRRSGSSLASFEDACSHLTGGALFSEDVHNSERYSAFENFKSSVEGMVTRARDRIVSSGKFDFSSMFSIMESEGSQLTLPRSIYGVIEESWNIAAGGSSLLQRHRDSSNSSKGFSGAIHLGVSVSFGGADREFGLQLGYAIGADNGSWKAGYFIEVFGFGSFETDIGVGFSFHLGFWGSMGYIAGKAVDFGLNLDLGIIAPALTASSFGTAAALSQAAMSLHGVRTVPDDSECGKGGWTRSQMTERNCDDIRWGTYNPPNGKTASDFAAIVISLGWGQSFSPVSGDLGASCTWATWKSGYSGKECFDFSNYQAETKAWRIVAKLTKPSNWAWDVFELNFKTADGRSLRSSDGCTAISSGNYNHPSYSASQAFGGGGLWGGRKSGSSFYLGLKCNDVKKVTTIELKQGGHYASEVIVESSADGNDWSMEEVVSFPHRNGQPVTIWNKR